MKASKETKKQSSISLIALCRPSILIRLLCSPVKFQNMSFEESQNKLLSIGPFGSKGGDDIWDDGVHSTVRQLLIHADVNGIRWIQIEYDDNGQSVWSDKHGADYPTLLGARTYKVELDYPDEFLTSVHGRYIHSWSPMPTYITKLNFRSNKRSYGPFGSQDLVTKYFSIEASGSKIVGFHGRAHNWWLLRALGAYLKPIDHHHHHHHHHQQNQDKDVDKPSTLPKQDISYIVSGNQVTGNEGNHNGAFVVGSNPKHIVFNVRVT